MEIIRIMCKGITLKGEPCKREDFGENPEYCGLHQSQGFEEEWKRYEIQSEREMERWRRNQE